LIDRRQAVSPMFHSSQRSHWNEAWYVTAAEARLAIYMLSWIYMVLYIHDVM
jgi:hypothetical protein